MMGSYSIPLTIETFPYKIRIIDQSNEKLSFVINNRSNILCVYLCASYPTIYGYDYVAFWSFAYYNKPLKQFITVDAVVQNWTKICTCNLVVNITIQPRFLVNGIDCTQTLLTPNMSGKNICRD